VGVRVSQAIRTAIAMAVESVAGIKCSPYFQQTTTPGSGMVRLDRIEYPNRFGGVAFWQVLILLPQELAPAEKYMEGKVPELYEALAPELAVTSISPREIVLNDGVRLPCLVIEGHREEE